MPDREAQKPNTRDILSSCSSRMSFLQEFAKRFNQTLYLPINILLKKESGKKKSFISNEKRKRKKTSAKPLFLSETGSYLEFVL